MEAASERKREEIGRPMSERLMSVGLERRLAKSAIGAVAKVHVIEIGALESQLEIEIGAPANESDPKNGKPVNHARSVIGNHKKVI